MFQAKTFAKTLENNFANVLAIEHMLKIGVDFMQLRVDVKRKPCYRKETARCCSCSFRFKVRRHHLLQNKLKSSQAPKALNIPAQKTEFN